MNHSATLTIGAGTDAVRGRYAAFLQAQLKAAGVESSIVALRYAALEELGAALSAGAFDAAAYPMECLPAVLPEGLTITAVSAREHAGIWLLVRPDAFTPGEDFSLKKGATVAGNGPLLKAQLLDYRKDITFQEAAGSMQDSVAALRRGECDAAMLSAAGIHRHSIDLSGLEVVPINPKELMPAPGQGVLAYLTRRDDVPVRRILKKIHHPEVSAVTNIERGVLRLLGSDAGERLGVYCERDTAHNYHVWAAFVTASGVLKKARLSSSTTHQLAERVAGALG